MPLNTFARDLAALVINQIYDQAERRTAIRTYAFVALNLIAGILLLLYYRGI